MSYDLYFWREIKVLNYSLEEKMLKLENDGVNQEFACFPVNLVKECFKKVFPGIIDEGSQLLWEGSGSSFNVGFTYSDETNIKMIIVSCGYGLLDSPDEMNKIISAGASLGCALYDPQLDQRFEQPDLMIDQSKVSVKSIFRFGKTR